MLNFCFQNHLSIYLSADKWFSQSDTAEVVPVLRYCPAFYGDINVCVREPVLGVQATNTHGHIYSLSDLWKPFVCSDEDTFRCHKCLLKRSEVFSMCVSVISVSCLQVFFFSSPVCHSLPSPLCVPHVPASVACTCH